MIASHFFTVALVSSAPCGYPGFTGLSVILHNSAGIVNCGFLNFPLDFGPDSGIMITEDTATSGWLHAGYFIGLTLARNPVTLPSGGISHGSYE